MFIFRRISENDADFDFITGNIAFDEKNPDGSLKVYLNEDIVSGGEFYTHLFIEKNNSNETLILGLLRYKFTNKEEFLSELKKCEVEEEFKNNLIKELDKKRLSFIYLSRIGVVKNYQDMNIGQIISNFFEFLIKRNREWSFIFVKVIEKHKDFIAPSYDFIAHNDDNKWGSYYLASKYLDFD